MHDQAALEHGLLPALKQKISARWFPLFLVGIVIAYVIGCLDLINVEIDDVFITLRFSRNILAGHGAVFNPGEPVEGYSHPTWLFLVTAVAGATGLTSHLALFYLSKVLCIVFGLMALIATYWLAKLNGNSKPVIAMLLLTLALSPFLNTYNISGMETPLVTFLLTFSVVLHHLWREHRTLAYALGFALVLGILCVSRPEGIIYPVALYAGIFLIGARDSSERLPYLRVTLMTVFAFLVVSVVLRFEYYGELVPNTLLAKNNPGFGAARDGIRYVVLFLAFTVSPYVLLLLSKRTPTLVRAHAPIYLAVVAQFLFVIYAGGDWMPSFRLLLPVLPLIWFIIVDQVDIARLVNGKVLVATVIAVLVTVSTMALQRDYIRASYKPFVTGLNLRVQPYNEDYLRVAEKLKEISSPHQSVLIAEAGLIPYLNDDLRFDDLYGLIDKHVAKEVKGSHFTRVDNDYFFSRSYDFFVAISTRGKQPVQRNGKYDTGFVAVDAFLNDVRFKTRYTPVYEERRGVIFRKNLA